MRVVENKTNSPPSQKMWLACHWGTLNLGTCACTACISMFVCAPSPFYNPAELGISTLALVGRVNYRLLLPYHYTGSFEPIDCKRSKKSMEGGNNPNLLSPPFSIILSRHETTKAKTLPHLFVGD